MQFPVLNKHNFKINAIWKKEVKTKRRKNSFISIYFSSICVSKRKKKWTWNLRKILLSCYFHEKYYMKGQKYSPI